MVAFAATDAYPLADSTYACTVNVRGNFPSRGLTIVPIRALGQLR